MGGFVGMKGHETTFRTVDTEFPPTAPREELRKACKECFPGITTKRFGVIIGFRIRHNIIRIEKEMKEGRRLINVINQNKEEKGSKNRALGNTSENILPH